MECRVTTPGTILIPANLIDQNVVRMLNAGTFPKPNFNNGTQFLLAVPQPTNLREEVIRIDHTINSKYQLMGHYLHDAVSQGIYPPLWGNSSLSNGGHSHEEPLMVIHHQADANVLANLAQ